VNRDGQISVLDLVQVAVSYGSQVPVSSPADVNADGWVNLFDLVAVARCMGSATPPAPTPTSTPTVPTPQVYPTPMPPTPPDGLSTCYILTKEFFIGAYAIREWSDAEIPEHPAMLDVLTLSAVGQPQIQIDYPDRIDDVTGSDITGEGHPDLAVHTFSGGAHCCFNTIVYDLGPIPIQVMNTPPMDCDGEFQDLDRDGRPEFVTCDNPFAYRYCCGAGSPMVKVILQYRVGHGFVPASPSFQYAYDQDIGDHTRQAEQAQPGGSCELDGTTKCAVLPLVLDYLYSGRPVDARNALWRFYLYADEPRFENEIWATVTQSPLYTPY